MDIKQEILDYINTEENNGAFLLAGKWGCGKSYLVKDIVKEINEDKEYAVAIISLFGIDTITALNRRIKDEYLEFQSELFGKKARKIYDVFSKLAKESAAITAAALPDKASASAVSVGVNAVTSFDVLNFITVKNTVKMGDKEKKFVLIFDDFERSSIPQIQLMGAINEYSENRKIKTILIADEDKIREDDYSDFKEKLISRTIRINPDHSETIHNMIQNYKSGNDEYKEFLKECEVVLLAAYEDSDYNNLRSFKSCLIDFERVFTTWKSSDIPMDDIKNVLYTFCAITYEYKAGYYVEVRGFGYLTFGIHSNKEDDKENKHERDTIVRKYRKGTFSSFLLTLSDWVVNGNWNKQEFLNEIRRQYVVDELSTDERFLGFKFWDLEQEDIDKGMPVAVERACNGELSRDDYIILLQRIHSLKKNDIELPCNVDYEKIKNGFEIRKNNIKIGTIEEPQRHLFSENHQLDEEAIEIYNNIELCDTLIFAWENRREFINCLKSKNINGTHELEKKYLDCFDDELYNLVIITYNEVPNSDKRQLCWAITKCDYSKSFNNTKDNLNITINNFNKLKGFLEDCSQKTNDKISKAIDKYFCDEIDKKIAEIQE